MSPGDDAGDGEDAGARDAGCENPCGEDCCGANERCVGGRCECEPDCDGLHCFSDGCGGTCACPAGTRCEAGTGECRCKQTNQELCAAIFDSPPACGELDATDACGFMRHVDCGPCAEGTCDPDIHRCTVDIPESDAELCENLGYECGPLDAVDHLGTYRHIDSCGACADEQTCESGRCQCAPETNAELCDAQGWPCTPINVFDRCGTRRVVQQCTECGAGQTCGEDGICHTCEGETDAELCLAARRGCGSLVRTDRCGIARVVLECGPCALNSTCDRGLCRCVPETDGELCAAAARLCGPMTASDRCGVQRTVAECGTCGANQVCDAGGVCRCVPETDAELCTAAARQCGPAITTDRCGTQRTIADCGTCAANQACDASGVCRCVPETDADLCAAAARQCGPAIVTDRCGVQRTVADCGACSAHHACDAGGMCRCVPETDAELCLAATRDCDSYDATDRCGTQRHVANCGTCIPGFVCDGGVCGPIDCVPETDAALCLAANANCGPLATTDICGNARLVTSCGSCSVPTPYCDQGQCVCEPDWRFCARLHRCGSVTGVDRCGVTRTVAACDCAPGERCSSNGTCRGWSLNDDCSLLPQPITLSNVGSIRTATVTDDTRFAWDDTTSQYCGGAGGPDLFFSLDLSGLMSFVTVDLVVTPAVGSSFQPVVSLRRSSCAQPSDEIACAAASSPGAVAVHTARFWSGTGNAGSFWVVVDGASSSDAGAFTLSVSVQTFGPGAVDVCMLPPALPLTGGSSQVTSTTGTAVAGFSGTCGTMVGAENAYSVTLPSTQNSIMEVSVQRSASSPGWLPAVYVRSNCYGPSDLACAVGSGGTASLRTPPLSGGTYYVLVDSLSLIPGAFTLTVKAGPVPANDACATPTTLTFNSSGQSSVPFDTRWAVDDSTGACGTLKGPDVVFKATVPPHMHVTLTAARDAADSTYEPALYLQPDCATVPSPQRCAVSSSGTATLASDPCGCATPGDVLIFVDGDGGTRGRGQLTATFATSASTCATSCCASDATPLAIVASGTITATDSTAGLPAVNYGSCASAGSEAQFRFDLAIERKVEITVTPDAGSTARHSVYVTSGTCDVVGSDAGCAVASTAGAPVSLVLSQLAAGAYYLTVDGATPTDSGAFALSVTTSPP